MEKQKVMIIDDEYSIRELVALSLSDYNVIKVPDGATALKMVESDKPDLIILDIMMPEIDGFSVCKQLKENKLTSEIPIIMLTAKHLIEDVKKAISVGAEEYITKPFEPDFLIKRVDAYLKSDKAQDSKFLHYNRSMHYVKGKD